MIQWKFENILDYVSQIRLKLITISSSNIFIVSSGKGRRRKLDHACRHCRVPGYRGCCDDRCCCNHCEKKVGLFEILLLFLLMLLYGSSLLLFFVFVCLKNLLFLAISFLIKPCNNYWYHYSGITQRTSTFMFLIFVSLIRSLSKGFR